MYLQTLIDCLTFNSNLHICIHDVSGILLDSHLNLLRKNQIHSKEICNLAKSTEKGICLCTKCKALATSKAIKEKKLFIGHCPFGITEVVQPVVGNGVVLAIIFIGNIIEDDEFFNQCMKKASKSTGVSLNKLMYNKGTICKINDVEYFIKMAKLIDDCIKLLYNSYNISIKPNSHWAVEAFKNYILEYYNKNISLSQISKLYNINETYISRIFKQKTGMSFVYYLNLIRISEACVMLERSNSSILDIALGTGFSSISYFNRVFKSFKNQTPTEYRNKQQLSK